MSNAFRDAVLEADKSIDRFNQEILLDGTDMHALIKGYNAFRNLEQSKAAWLGIIQPLPSPPRPRNEGAELSLLLSGFKCAERIAHWLEGKNQKEAIKDVKRVKKRAVAEFEALMDPAKVEMIVGWPPESVPGFLAETWFCRGQNGIWLCSDTEPELEEDMWDERALEISDRSIASVALQQFDEVPWMQSKFKTREDG